MPDIQQDEVKKAIGELATAFEEHKKVNDARLEALRKERGTADFDEKLDRIGEAMNAQERIIRKAQKLQEEAEAKRLALDTEAKAQQDEWLRKIEARANRIALGLGGAEGEANPNERLERKAYNSFLRKGIERMAQDEVKVLTVSNDVTGGYLSPPTFAAEIIKAEVLFSPMRSLVTVRPVGTSEFQQPKRTQTAAATRQAETGTRAETQNVNWGLVKIAAPEMYAEARITWANLEDSAFDLEGLLRDEFAEQFGVKEGAEVVAGTGVGMCQGFTDASAGVAYTASGQAATIAGATAGQAGAADPLITFFHAVKTAYAKNGTWCLNRASLGKVRQLKDTTGQYLWQPGLGQSGALATGIAPTILGAPYCECPDMPDEGANAYPIAFGDWKRAYTLAERLDIVIVRDPYTVASSGQVKFFARRRVGGQVVLAEAIRLYKCAAS